MELKTDGGIYITKDEYRNGVKKVMDRQIKEACIAGLITCIESDLDPDKANGTIRDALKLQLQALENLEKVLFGTSVKKDEEVTKDD